jgi:hypothetical protein
LRAVLRLCRRQQRAAWFLRGRPFPDLVFPSLAGTTLQLAIRAAGRSDASIELAVAQFETGSGAGDDLGHRCKLLAEPEQVMNAPI